MKQPTRKTWIYIALVAAFILVGLTAYYAFSFYTNPARQFVRAYDAYRSVDTPDSGKLDEWDKQMSGYYLAAKDASERKDEEATAVHLNAMYSVIRAQEEYYEKLDLTLNNQAALLPIVRTGAARLTGRDKTLAKRLADNETKLLGLGKKLNAGSKTEMKYWRELGSLFNTFRQGTISGTVFLSQEDIVFEDIAALHTEQEDLGKQAVELVGKINADWKTLAPSL